MPLALSDIFRRVNGLDIGVSGADLLHFPAIGTCQIDQLVHLRVLRSTGRQSGKAQTPLSQFIDFKFVLQFDFDCDVRRICQKYESNALRWQISLKITGLEISVFDLAGMAVSNWLTVVATTGVIGSHVLLFHTRFANALNRVGEGTGTHMWHRCSTVTSSSTAPSPSSAIGNQAMPHWGMALRGGRFAAEHNGETIGAGWYDFIMYANVYAGNKALVGAVGPVAQIARTHGSVARGCVGGGGFGRTMNTLPCPVDDGTDVLIVGLG